MIVVIGEILIDCFPEYERIGGAPFNFAFHLRHLGWPVRFITRIGDDPQGRRIGRHLAKHGFAPEDLQIDAHRPTGRVEITLDKAGIPQFDIVTDVAYDHIDLPAMTPEDKSAVKMFYFGSLFQRTANGRRQVEALMEDKPPASRCFCDINLRPPHVHDLALDACLRHADILKLNADELGEICRRLNGPPEADAAVDWLMRTHGIGIVAVTLGAEGSRVFTTRGRFAAPPAEVNNLKDTVGAGDAYAAVLAAGLLHNMPLPRILTLATRFAADICALSGALPDDTTLYAPLTDPLERIPHGQ